MPPVNSFFPECVAKGSRLWLGVWGLELCLHGLRRVVVCRRLSSSLVVCRRLSSFVVVCRRRRVSNLRPLGEAFASDFSWMCHVSVCAAITL